VSFIIRVREKERDTKDALLGRPSLHPVGLFIREGYKYDHKEETVSVPCALVRQESPDIEPEVLLWANESVRSDKSNRPFRDLTMSAYSELRRLCARGHT